MTASNYTMTGKFRAIQYTGSNVSDITAELGSTWAAYTSSATTTLALSQIGNEQYALNGLLVHPTEWMVSLPTYGNVTPALSGGFSVVTNSNFVTQYV